MYSHSLWHLAVCVTWRADKLYGMYLGFYNSGEGGGDGGRLSMYSLK